MISRIVLFATCALLATTACDDDYGGYYWWDETDDVWCYTYSDGTTECDAPYDHHRDGDRNGGNGDDEEPGASDDDATDDDVTDPTEPTPTEGDPADDGTADDDATDDDTADDDTSNPQCTTLDDGSRQCIVVDGDHVCEFTYGADGAITGACAEINDPDGETRSDCERTNAGGLFCEFQDADGTQCVAIFDERGVVEYDSCDYFVDEDEPT